VSLITTSQLRWDVVKNGLKEKKSKIQCQQNFILSTFNPQLIRRVDDEKSSPYTCIGGSAIFVGGRWTELGPVKNWAKSLHK
jgi:hypothetical protein